MSPRDGRRTPREPASEAWIERLLKVCALVSVFTTVAIVLVLAWESLQFFVHVPLRAFLLDTQWTPLFSDARFGIWPLVTGTLLTSTLAIGVALPFGLAAAIYLSEFAAPWVRRTLEPTLEVLAGVPTIVYGYFALVFLTPWLQRAIGDLAGFNALSPGIMMGVMIIPMISSLSEEAISSVPSSLREGAYALGASRLRTIFGVVLPTARSGIAAAVMLAIARALGETMIVTIAAGQQPRLTLDPRVPIETMTAFIVQVGLGDVPAQTPAYRTIFVVGASLFVMTSIINLAAQRLARKAHRR